MVRKIIQIGDPVLYQKSAAVEQDAIKSDEVQGLIDDLIDTCEAEKDSTAGLSAIQVGVPKRIFVARVFGEDEEGSEEENFTWQVFINPEIEILHNTNSQIWEGCLSIGEGDERLFAPVRRPRGVLVNYLDRDGQSQQLEVWEYNAHVMQHEYDHLEGKLFLSYVSNPVNIWKAAELDDYIETHDSYPPVE